jgi:hypothetical protein
MCRDYGSINHCLGRGPLRVDIMQASLACVCVKQLEPVLVVFESFLYLSQVSPRIMTSNHHIAFKSLAWTCLLARNHVCSIFEDLLHPKTIILTSSFLYSWFFTAVGSLSFCCLDTHRMDWFLSLLAHVTLNIWVVFVIVLQQSGFGSPSNICALQSLAEMC